MHPDQQPINPQRDGAALGSNPVDADNWSHRDRNMKCGTCMWFVNKGCYSLPTGETHPGGWLGRCRRHAPTISGFPAVWSGDWCGDHKIDETKI